jgi:hypothetical protein
MAERKRKYPGERMYDLLTEEQIVPSRPGLEGVPLERLAEHGLDLIPGSRVRRGEGKYASKRNAALHRLENLPRHAPGLSGTFGIGSQGKLLIRPCWLCRELVPRYESQVAAAEGEHRRFVCPACDAIWRPALQRARRAVDELYPDGHLPTPSSKAIVLLLATARAFETEMRARIPARRGQPRRYDMDLAIEALCLRGFRDDDIDRILAPVGAQYTRTRRRNAGIRRRQRKPQPLPRFSARQA